MSTAAIAQSADIVFTGGGVVTMDADAPVAEAVAVTGNKITYVGDTAGAKH